MSLKWKHISYLLTLLMPKKLWFNHACSRAAAYSLRPVRDHNLYISVWNRATAILHLSEDSLIKRKYHIPASSYSYKDFKYLIKNISNSFISPFPLLLITNVSTAVSSVSFFPHRISNGYTAVLCFFNSSTSPYFQQFLSILINL